MPHRPLIGRLEHLHLGRIRDPPLRTRERQHPRISAGANAGADVELRGRFHNPTLAAATDNLSLRTASVENFSKLFSSPRTCPQCRNTPSGARRANPVALGGILAEPGAHE